MAYKNEEVIKAKIVAGYKRGVCNADGGDIPVARRGNAGRGSRFRWYSTDIYRREYDRIYGVR